MEQTLGKRIMMHRKKLGLTQEQLAEQLGVTAQAVSKWENDQSCPDISMLPKLAERFGITTDALLGREPEPVFDAEVVDGRPGGQDTEGFHIQNGNWEFHWDAGKRAAVLTASAVLTVGILLLAGNLLKWNVSFWGILWPTALLYTGISGLFRRFSFFNLGCTLFGGYFLLDNLNVLPFRMGWNLALPLCLVLFGISLLADALRKPRNPSASFRYDGIGKNDSRTICDIHGDTFRCSVNFNEGNYRIDMETLAQGSITTSFGDCTVDLSGVQTLAEDCDVTADCKFGDLEILVPRRFRVKPHTASAFANIHISGQPDDQPQGILRLSAHASFGEIEIRYI